jgi:hypothetical protein
MTVKMFWDELEPLQTPIGELNFDEVQEKLFLDEKY